MEIGQEARAAEAKSVERERELETLKTEADELKRLATHDELTGLLNRRAFMKEFSDEIARCQRYRHAVGFLIFDIDRFKSINDTHGHPVGDAVLRALGKYLLNQVRRCDVVGRWGGEEFVILLPEAENQEGVVGAAEKLRRGIEAASPNWVAEVSQVTVSIGAAFARFDTEGFGAESIIEAADKCLYQAKKSGRNRVCAVTL